MKEMDTASEKERCPRCGKTVSPEHRSGSLTSYLFRAMECSCDATLPAASPQSQMSTTEDGEFCPKCGLRIGVKTRDGSLTGFLFGSTRCKCPPDQAFADGKISARFYQLQKAGAGTTFIGADAPAKTGKGASIGLMPGAIIGGVYKIEHLIGRGGMGEVYLATHQALGKKCALKVIPPDEVTEVGWQRFQLEARAVGKLDHINLVRVTDLGIHEGCLPFYAMDYVEGQTLADILAGQGTIPLKQVLEIFVQVCEGVDCAHRSGILHRDLKPANIMVVKTRGTELQAKILDFGLAKLTGQDREKQGLTAVGDIFGSPFYMSPEQCQGERLDNRSDIYSIGCTMFECLAGRPPFTGNLSAAIIFSHQEADPPSLESAMGRKAFPDAMEIVIAKLLRKNPVERYQTLIELRDDLKKVAAGEGVLPVYMSRSGRTSGRTVKPIRGDLKEKRAVYGWYAPASVVSLIALVMAAGIFYWRDVLTKNEMSPAGSPGRWMTGQKKARTSLASPLAGEKPAAGSKFESPLFDAELSSFDPSIAPKAGKKLTPYLVADDGSTRTFVFPGGVSLGSFSFHDQTKSTQESDGMITRPAKKKQVVPSKVDLHLEASDSLILYPEYFGGLGPNDLSSLSFSAYGDWSDKHVAYASALAGLKAINLEGGLITDQSIASLDKLVKLEDLTIKHASITGLALCKLKRLKQLKALNLYEANDAKSVLTQLAFSKTLEYLSMRDSSLTDREMQKIATLPGLKILEISDNHLSDGGLQFLSRLTQLSHLSIDGNRITPAAIPFLKMLPLQTLRLNVAGWPNQAKALLRQELPHCRIKFELSETY